MAQSKKKQITPMNRQYQEFAKAREQKRPVVRNLLRAFVAGGTICLCGQFLIWLFITYFHFTEKTAGNPASAVLIMLSVLLTGLGVYDLIAQWAGAGTAVPVTGFANSIASAAIEHKSEGWVLGVGGQMFKIAGSVIVFGVVSAFFVALVRIIITQLLGAS